MHLKDLAFLQIPEFALKQMTQSQLKAGYETFTLNVPKLSVLMYIHLVAEQSVFFWVRPGGNYHKQKRMFISMKRDLWLITRNCFIRIAGSEKDLIPRVDEVTLNSLHDNYSFVVPCS